jgi:hypothetical protein
MGLIPVCLCDSLNRKIKLARIAMNSAAQMSKGPRRVSGDQLRYSRVMGGDVPKLPESLAEIMVNRR